MRNKFDPFQMALDNMLDTTKQKNNEQNDKDTFLDLSNLANSNKLLLSKKIEKSVKNKDILDILLNNKSQFQQILAYYIQNYLAQTHNYKVIKNSDNKTITISAPLKSRNNDIKLNSFYSRLYEYYYDKLDKDYKLSEIPKTKVIIVIGFSDKIQEYTVKNIMLSKV